MCGVAPPKRIKLVLSFCDNGAICGMFQCLQRFNTRDGGTGGIIFVPHGGTTGSASDQQSTNERKVAGSRPTKVVCITVLTGNRLG